MREQPAAETGLHHPKRS